MNNVNARRERKKRETKRMKNLDVKMYEKNNGYSKEKVGCGETKKVGQVISPSSYK